MPDRLYQKNRLWFSLVWILVYVTGTSAADLLSKVVGAEKSVTLVFHAAMGLLALVWLKRNGLMKKYGLCAPAVPAARFLYYIPLVFLASCNLWFGTAVNAPLAETLLFIGSMLCVGFLEELIFRGFLFEALREDNKKSAVMISSLTFGIGHIVNLLNGSGMSLISNLCQVFYAVAFGFLFVIIFCRGKSLLPCIVTHGVINSLSAFVNEANITPEKTIIASAILAAAAVVYAVFLTRSIPQCE